MATIIFDFDGTIADSFDYVANFLSRQIRKGRELTPTERQALRGMTMDQMARYLGSPWWYMPVLFVIGRRAMSKVIYDVPLFAGMGKVIDELHAEGHTLMVVSSNNSRNIKKFLRHHHLYTFFTDIHADAGFFGKRRAIRTLLWLNRLKAKDAIYIGDESRDVIAAHAAGVRAIAAAWGFDHAEILAKHKPLGVAQVPQDIVRILEEN